MEPTMTDWLTDALERAAAAHGLHEQEIGRADPDWPRWYAEYMTRTAGQDGYIPAHRAAPAVSHAEVR
jgi:hypothetical protein